MVKIFSLAKHFLGVLIWVELWLLSHCFLAVFPFRKTVLLTVYLLNLTLKPAGWPHLLSIYLWLLIKPAYTVFFIPQKSINVFDYPTPDEKPTTYAYWQCQRQQKHLAKHIWVLSPKEKYKRCDGTQYFEPDFMNVNMGNFPWGKSLLEILTIYNYVDSTVEFTKRWLRHLFLWL